jgi:Fe-S cluster biogenesis protein NfuA
VTTATKKQVEEILDSIVRPLLELDGGNIRLESLTDDGTLFVSLTGRCAGCPGADFTMQDLVVPAIKKNVEGIKTVNIMPWHLPFND